MRLLLAVLALALAGCGDNTVSPAMDKIASPATDNPRLGLFTSLPILWAGNDAFGSLAKGDTSTHWAQDALRTDYQLQPIDLLDDASLAGLDTLVLAQPRALSPAENVALDNWVRGGGQVLLFADPKLVGDYDFPLGDPRRPLDTVLLSPILARWGVELLQGDDAATVRAVPMGGSDMVVAAAGQFRRVPAEGAECALSLEAVLARCTVGAGRVTMLADATLLEDPEGGRGSPAALAALLGMTRDAGGNRAR
ncbi:Gldg family protein [Qipengyuania sp. CAU 1752]